jgi:hypothetical protein
MKDIMREFQIAETLFIRGYITTDAYEKYKKDTANELLQAWCEGSH